MVKLTAEEKRHERNRAKWKKPYKRAHFKQNLEYDENQKPVVVPDYHPLTKRMIRNLLYHAHQTGHPGVRNSIEIRLLQGIKGYAFPCLPDDNLRPRENEISRLYLENHYAVPSKGLVNKLFKIMNSESFVEESEYPIAKVSVVNGQMVLEDPMAFDILKAIAKKNCQKTLEINADRVLHFKKRASELQRSADEVVIVIINVDDEIGNPLAEALMPGTNWQEIRDRGETPFARGLAMREGIQAYLEEVDVLAAEKLKATKELSVVVVNNCVAEIFSA